MGTDTPSEQPQPVAIRPTPANASATPTHCDLVSRSRRIVHASRTVATGYSDHAQAAANEGFYILRKPYSMDGLHDVLREALAAGTTAKVA